MLYRETSARNAIKLRLSIISILLFSKNILQGASITLTSQMRKRIRDAAFFLIIMLVTFAATLLNPQKYVSSRTIQKCVEHVSTST